MYRWNGVEVSQSDAADAPVLLPQAATALTRNHPLSFPPPALDLGQAFAGSATSSNWGDQLCFCSLLCLCLVIPLFPFSFLFLAHNDDDDTQLNHERTLGGSCRRSSIHPLIPLSKPQFKTCSKNATNPGRRPSSATGSSAMNELQINPPSRIP